MPSLRKQVAKTDATMDGLRKKQSDALKRASQLQSELAAQASSLCIRGEEAERELTEQLAMLPALLSDVTDKVTPLKGSLEYYRGFARLATNTTAVSLPLCPLIEYLTEKGNTTYFEYVNGERADVIDDGEWTQSKDGLCPQDGGPGIDLGDAIDYGDDIDFGDNEPGSGSAATMSTTDSFVHVRDSQAASKTSSAEDGDTGSQSGERVARGCFSLTLIEQRGSREALVHELRELQSFLQQRLFEQHSQAAQEAASVLMGSRLSTVVADAETLRERLAQVHAALAALTGERLKTLFLIREDGSFCKTVARKLEQKRELAAKAQAEASAISDKQRQVMHEKINMMAQIPVLIAATALLESRLTQDISVRYNHRPVNIMAGAQTL